MGSPSDRQVFDFMAATRGRVEGRLSRTFSNLPDSEMRRIGEYVSLKGGHRWRSLLAMATARVFCDEEDALRRVLPSACAVELTHAASLLLDDLPSMDDAKVRRGKPCAHLIFAPWAIDMASPFLIMLAYRLILENEAVGHGLRIRTLTAMTGAGLDMCHGQEMDLLDIPSQEDSERLLDCYVLKSGVLFAVAVKAAAVQCEASETEIDSLTACGERIGMAYQHLDDLSDVLRPVERSGKLPGMDAQKTTAIDLYGVDGVKRRIVDYLEQSRDCLECFGRRADLLRGVLDMLDWKSW